jgi:hypothetical protein
MTHIYASRAHRQRSHMTILRFDHRCSDQEALLYIVIDEVNSESGPELVTRVSVAMHGPRRGFHIARTVLIAYTLKLLRSHRGCSLYRPNQCPASIVCGMLHAKNHVVTVAVQYEDAFSPPPQFDIL